MDPFSGRVVGLDPGGQVYELLTPFEPAPRMELARGKGFAAYSSHEEPGLVRTYFSASAK